MHDGTVEICECIGGIKGYGLIHVSYPGIIIPFRCIEPSSTDISFRLETVKGNGLVVVRKSLCRIFKEEVAGSPVEIRGRVIGLFPYIPVKIAHRFSELLREKIGHSPAEIQAIITGP